MTPDQLIAEGRRLQRPTAFLRPRGSGPVAARWYERDEAEIESTGDRCWLTVDARHIPDLPSTVSGYVSVFTDEEGCEGGHVELTESWPDRSGTDLYAQAASVLPPVDAVFAFGSDVVGDWVHSHNWDRGERYNENFGGSELVKAYERIWQREHPLYVQSDVYAVLGGWHVPMADDDWHDRATDTLMVFTIRDSEPWVEAWRTRDGGVSVIQRVT